MKAYLAAAFAAATLLACSSDSDSSNTPPVIDSIDGPEETTPQGGNHAVTLELRWHDDDKDTITSVRYRITEAGIDQTTTAQGAGPNVVGAKLTLHFPGNVPKKPYEILFSVFDSRGAESAPVAKTITVK